MEIFSKREIRERSALASTYDKGLSLFEDDSVFDLSAVRSAQSMIDFEAEVWSDSGNEYQTMIQAEWRSDSECLHICTGNCTCQAFSTYGGFCKHLVATAFEVNYSWEFWEISDLIHAHSIGEGYQLLYLDEELPNYDGDGISTASARVFSGKPAVPPPTTSKELLDIISEIELRDRNQFCREISQGDVQLEVTLHIDPDSEELSLRIGKTQMYVVKNIRELAQHIRQQDYVKYGKKLEFVHTQSAFSKDTLPFVSFLLGIQFPELNHYFDYYYDYRSAGEKRRLKLDAAMLDDVMELFCGRSLYVDCSAKRDTKLTMIEEADPLLPVTLEMSDRQNLVQMKCPKIILLEGMRHTYVYWKDTIYRCSEEYAEKMGEILRVMAINLVGNERNERVIYYRSYKSQRILELSEKDYTSFVSTLLPILEQYTKLKIKDIDFTKYEPQEARFELYLDLTDSREVVCDAKVLYGEDKYPLTKTATVLETFRDVRNEYEVRTLVSGYFPEKTEDGTRFLLREDEDRMAELVENGIRQFEELADVYISDALKMVRVVRKSVVSAGLSIQGNLLEVSWDVTEMSQDELYDVLHAFRRKKKYYRLRTGELLNLTDSGLEVLADMQEDLHLSKAQLKEGKVSIPVYRALYMDALMKENANRLQIRRDEQFEQYLDKLDDVSHREYPVPDLIQGELRGYQKEGFSWACSLAELGFGGILADDMGLGKTLQMITFLSYCKNGTHLIVSPASLVYNWEAEFQKFAPSMNVCLVVGNAAEREEILASYQDYDVLVTSYDLLRRDIDQYEGKSFGCEIIDEAQYIKNPATQASKAVKAIDSRIRFALTGTPIENRLSELWSIFEYLMPGYLYSYKHFKESFEEKIVQCEGENNEKALNRLHRMIAPFVMRRLKKEVLKDLPDKLEEIVYTKFGSRQEKLYRATEKNVVTNLKSKSGKEVQENKLQILAELTKLRQICCDPSLLYEDYSDGSAKLETCMEVIENALEGGHRILLFSQFTSMFDILEKRLKKEKIRYFVLTGSTSKIKRRELVDRFQRGEAEVFLISLKAGGTGLNLTAADVVVHYDPWWNVAAQNQATDRTHRIGQENEVTVLKLIARGTIEERILKLQEKKQDLADKVMAAEGVSVAGLSKEDLLELFKG